MRIHLKRKGIKREGVVTGDVYKDGTREKLGHQLENINVQKVQRLNDVLIFEYIKTQLVVLGRVDVGVYINEAVVVRPIRI